MTGCHVFSTSLFAQHLYDTFSWDFLSSFLLGDSESLMGSRTWGRGGIDCGSSSQHVLYPGSLPHTPYSQAKPCLQGCHRRTPLSPPYSPGYKARSSRSPSPSRGLKRLQHIRILEDLSPTQAIFTKALARLQWSPGSSQGLEL